MADEPNPGAPERDADLTSPAAPVAAAGTLEPLAEESPVDGSGAPLAAPSPSAPSTGSGEPVDPAAEAAPADAAGLDAAAVTAAGADAAADGAEQTPEGT